MRYFRSVIVRLLFVGCAALAVAAFALGWVDRQRSLARAETSVQDDAKHDALKQNFLAEHEIGRRFRIDPAGLPAPKTGPIVSNRALIVAYTGQAPQVPAGFTATPFATGLVNPRRLLVLPNGDVLVAEQSAGYLTLLRDDGSGHAVWIDRHVEDLNRPYGLAWQGDHVLVADQDGIWSVPHILGALRAGRSETLRVDQVPPEERKPIAGAYGAKMLSQKGVFGIVQGHQNRPLAVEPKSGALFVGVGSSGNVGVEPEPKATIQRFDADGSHQTTYASGMRNPTALAFQPQTGELYAAVQERDGLGNNLPSDYLTRVQQGGFYGWPYAYIGKHPQAGFANLAPDKVDATIVPDLLFQAHSSVLDFVFYDGEQFSAEYKGNAFVALKGSWNCAEPTGYKVVRVPFKDGRPERCTTRISSPASGSPASGARKCGDGPRRLRSRATARCSSPTIPAAQSGASPIRVRPTPCRKTSARRTTTSDAHRPSLGKVMVHRG